MKKKFLSLMLVVAMMAGILPTISFAAKLDGEITFVDASDNDKTVNYFEEGDKICARLEATAQGDGTINWCAASYNNGVLLGCDMSSGSDGFSNNAELNITTNTIKIADGADEVRVFAWDMKNNNKPLLEPGVIYKKLPTGGSGGSGSSTDVNNQNGFVGEEVSLVGENVSASVPEGVQLESGATELTLTMQSLDSSASGVEAGEGQALQSFDVHIDGVAEENNVPIIVTVDNFTKEGYNKGNLALYHVEKDGTKELSEVNSVAELIKHNTYYYNPETGSLTLALASFSEIAVVADTDKAWEGNYDYSWYTNAVMPLEEEENTTYKIANADQLAAFGKIVGGMADDIECDSFEGKTVTLTADINLADDEANNVSDKIFYPIGYWNDLKSYEKTANVKVTSSVSSFEGTFDGNGHTISNFYQNTWEMFGDYNDEYSGTPNHYKDAMGLFGYVVNGKVMNLTVDNFSSDGEFTPTGVIAAYAVNSEFSNIAITNCNPRVYNTGNGGIVGIGGNSDDSYDEENPDSENNKKLTFTNITIDNTNKISALWGSWDVACGGLVGMFRGLGKVDMINCNVAAQIDVYNDVCGNYQYYWYRYSGMMIGTNKNMTTDEDGYTVPETDKFYAENCTVHFGDWNDYYYCELVANSLASYTHDHQFSRLTQVDSVDTTNMTVTVGEKTTAIPTSGRYNYVVVNGTAATENATCYHFVDGAVWNHEDAGKETVDGKEVLKEDKQHYYLPFNQLFTGYGWGVKHIPIYDDGTPNPFAGVTILDRVEADSVEKFAKADAAKDSYTTGKAVTIGELFKEAAITDEKLTIKGDKVNVFVSPVGEGSTASAAYVANTDDWTQGTLTFDGIGAATVTITDYYFCEPTTITVTVEGTEKFKTINENFRFTHALETVETGRKIKLSELFETVEGAEIDLENIDVSIEGNATFTENADNWQDGTVTVTGDGVVTVTITDGDTCIPSVATITASAPDDVEKFNKKFNKKFIYRVGNKNTVSLATLFETNSIVKDADVKVTYEVIEGVDLSVMHTENSSDWDAGTLLFNNTGIIKISITDDFYCIPTELYLEVVDANNVTSDKNTIKSGSNNVLLENISSTGANISGNTLFGNGFSIDATGAPYSGTGSVSNNVIFTLDGGILDNVKIVGMVYPSYGATASENYNRALVLSKGSSKIINSYLSNTASPIRVSGGNLEVSNSTLKGGNFANLDIRNGYVTLEDVVTINQASLNDKASDGSDVVGLGVVVYYENVTEATVEINGELKQFNYISDNDKFSNTYASELVGHMLGSSYTDLQLEKDGVTWVNSGIVSMTESCGKENIIDNRTDTNGYTGKDAIFYGKNGYVRTKVPTEADIISVAPEYEATRQGAIEPAPGFDSNDDGINDAYFDFVKTNYLGKTDGSNDYCYEDGGVVYISMDEGDSFEWNTSIFYATKVGQQLSYKVRMGDVDYTDKSIEFDTEGDYTVVYEYTDNNNYSIDEDGNIVNYSESYTKSINFVVSIFTPETTHATFTFGPDATQSKEITIGNDAYVMPDGVEANFKSGGWGTITVSGNAVTYPIVEVIVVDKKYAYFPIFKNAVSITDSSGVVSTETMPSTLQVINGKYGEWSGLNGLNDTSLNFNPETYGTNMAGKVFSYAAAEGSYAIVSTYNNALCYKSPELTNERNEYYTIAKFCYTDEANKPFYYYVGYHIEAKGDGSCITPDTLITLADGTQKEVQYLTGREELLVWNLETGSYDTAPIVFVDSDAESEYEVVNLCFSDGTEVGVIYEHGFFDLDIGEYVYIDAENAKEYIGHRFVKQGDIENNTWESVTLEDVVIEKRLTKAYSPVTFEHLCYYTDGVLSMPGGIKGLFNIFEVDTQIMAYDSEKMAEDIAKYGLYTYEDFEGVVSELGYYAFNGDILKVAIGKGILTWDDIKYYAERYMPIIEENN